MAMMDDNVQHDKVTVSCKNCDKFITFFYKPKGQPLIGSFFCTLLCIDQYEKKQKKAKENLTEQTLKK